ncbi:hypothetical protein N407_05475 [Helicobacter pylori FD662]|nr:hypothetical protein N407_05475 [Helicobacter pylori FD662]
MLNDKKDKMIHFLNANEISFNAYYLKNALKV